jgi:hypothetical protein
VSLPTGIRSYNYAQDMAVFRTRAHWVWLGVLLAFLFTGPLYWGNYWLGVGNLIGITIVGSCLSVMLVLSLSVPIPQRY